MTLKKRHFTLIELLVVMGLIGLLVSLAVPTFTRLAKGKTTPAATDQIKRQLEEAQAIAIANRSYVGLVIINGSDNFNFEGDSDDLAANPDQYRLASTRAAFLFKSGSDYYFDKWAPNSSWSKPIEGARITEVTSSYSDVPKDGEKKEWSIKTTSTLRSPLSDIKRDSSNTLRKCAVVFAPDGSLDSRSDIFLFVSACTANGTDLTFADSNTDYMILHVNRLSGKTVYFTRPDPNSGSGSDE